MAQLRPEVEILAFKVRMFELYTELLKKSSGRTGRGAHDF